MPYKHIPIMLDEVVRYLDCKPGKIYVDCTLGGSGHAQAILEKIMPDGFLIGIDQDKDAINNAKEVLKSYISEKNIHLSHMNFVRLGDILSELNILSVDGILLDLGVSLHQLKAGGRGFSFSRDEPLDMRMNTESDIRAEDIINGMSEKRLEKIFKEYGEERWARPIARKIVKTRTREKIRSSSQLARIVCDAVPIVNRKSSIVNQRIHPATRIFMALRIAVNKELERLDRFMKGIEADKASVLKPGGRLCVLSFHSLEDRIVKHRIKAMEKGCICPPGFPKCVCNKESVLRNLTKKVQRPAEKEVAMNPMARSAKLRAAEKISEIGNYRL
ncbi:16S rRNA (cytosine(1402)-N(4))-methyltransferase RsmH [Desulfobacterales bacterium HSG2]|nr:16S rRNA (cytosine(1402)-N(4))-methyltransferase RsmH [Desulfobacterales bacterium HSG2]